jgi:hypothetical protein
MEREIPSSIGNQAKRAEWFEQHARPGMTFKDACELNEQALRLFPVTLEEREQKWQELKDMPEFVL